MGRNIDTGNGFLRILIKILIIAAIAYGIYYVVAKTDLIKNIKEKTERTVEEITETSFSDIKYINTETDKNVSIEDFKNKYKDKKYKTVTDMKKLGEDGNVIYYVYSQNDKQVYKLFDLGDGYIKIVKESATLYQEVK